MKKVHTGFLLITALMLITGCSQPDRVGGDEATPGESAERPQPSGDPIIGGIRPQMETEAADARGFDPSGYWQGRHGPLVLMRAGDTISFSYSAVFGATAHICDGIGVAGFVGDGMWEYVDKAGTVTFTTRDDRVTMVTTDGIASFCGAYWPGDSFERAGWKAPFRCRVTQERTHFMEVGRLPPPRRPGYVVSGDWVEAWDLVNERSSAWLLTRFVGPRRTTAGLLERNALECEE